MLSIRKGVSTPRLAPNRLQLFLYRRQLLPGRLCYRPSRLSSPLWITVVNTIIIQSSSNLNRKLCFVADRLGPDEKRTSVPAGYPVVCVTPCDPKYPLFNISTQRLCRNMAIDVSKIRFSWEISPPLSTSDPLSMFEIYILLFYSIDKSSSYKIHCPKTATTKFKMPRVIF